MDSFDQELVENLAIIAVIAMALLAGNILANYFNEKFAIAKGYQTHLSSMRLAALFTLVPVVVPVLDKVDKNGSPESQLSALEAFVLAVVMSVLAYGLVTLRRWTIYVLGVLWAAGHIGLLLMVPIVMGPLNPLYFTLLVFVLFSWAVYSQLRHGYKYLKPRWADYR